MPTDGYWGVAHPPVLLVLTGAGPRGLKQRLEAVGKLTTAYWQSEKKYDSSCPSYEDKIPIVATTLDRLTEHGPTGKVFWRYGHDQWEPLTQALNHHDRNAWIEERQREEEARQRELEERERRRPSCTECGEKFGNDRYEHIWRKNLRQPDRPELCGPCERRAKQRAYYEAEARKLEEKLAAQEAARAEEAAREAAEEEAERKNRGIARFFR